MVVNFHHAWAKLDVLDSGPGRSGLVRDRSVTTGCHADTEGGLEQGGSWEPHRTGTPTASELKSEL